MDAAWSFPLTQMRAFITEVVSLLEEKVLAEDIVLAFVSPEMRRYTEFAVA